MPDKLAVAREMYFNQPEGFPFDNFRLEEVVLPPGDDLGVESDDSDAVEEAVESLDTGFSTSIAIDGLPVVGKEKFDKLCQVLIRKIGGFAPIKEDCLWMPQGPDDKTFGYAFVDYAKKEEATAAIKGINNFTFDREHTLKAYTVDDLDRLQAVPDTYSKPTVSSFSQANNSDMMLWLMDKRSRDQMLIQHNQEAQVCWNDAKKGKAELFFSQPAWSDGPMTWSPLGTYVATTHQPGVVLWASNSESKFERAFRFACPGVVKVNFSAHEEFITCYAVVEAPNKPIEIVMVTFDCRSGRKLRVLSEPLDNLLVGAMKVNTERIVEPFLQWSPAKPALAAKMTPNAVQVYEGVTMAMLGKQSLKLESVVSMTWSPAENLLAVFQAEHSNLPARVAIIELPSRTELRQKNLFKVQSAAIYWHAQGHYLAVKVSTYSKTGKTTYSSIELFNLKDRKNITNDVLEPPTKTDAVLELAWEPKGDRFAIIHSPDATARRNVSFYSMVDRTHKEAAKFLGTTQNKQVSQLHWSPAGHNILLAGIDRDAGQLVFYNVDDMQELRSQTHFMCNNVKWDQTGRYVCSWVDDNRNMEHGYIIWSFTGEMMYRCNLDGMWNFAWRPRPVSLLPPEKEADIAKNLRNYAKRFEEEDELLAAAVDDELLRKRRRMREEWSAFVEGKVDWRKQQDDHIERCLGYRLQPLPSKTVETEVQKVLEVKEEPYVA